MGKTIIRAQRGTSPLLGLLHLEGSTFSLGKRALAISGRPTMMAQEGISPPDSLPEMPIFLLGKKALTIFRTAMMNQGGINPLGHHLEVPASSVRRGLNTFMRTSVVTQVLTSPLCLHLEPPTFSLRRRTLTNSKNAMMAQGGSSPLGPHLVAAALSLGGRNQITVEITVVVAVLLKVVSLGAPTPLEVVLGMREVQSS